MKGYKVIPVGLIKARPFEVKDGVEKLYNALKAAIVQHGQVQTVMVREIAQDTEYEIVTGNKVLQILKETGAQSAFCYNLGPISEIEAKKLYLQTQILDNQVNYLKLSTLLCDLKETYPLNILSQCTIYEIEELKEIINLSSYDWEQFLKDEKEITGQTELFEV